MTAGSAAPGELAAPTPAAWFDAAAADLPTLLIDHANCEKKAASTAVGLMFAYGEDLPLGRALARLAREELRHYEQVLGLLKSQGISWRRLAPARYAQELRGAVARAEPLRRLDLLLVAALIEARSCERFAGLVSRLPGPVAAFYAGLAACEARHRQQYLEFAALHAAAAELDQAANWRRLATLEAELITRSDPEFRFHSGTPAPAAAARG
jgi:tRNA-(ms[2]io[6]A)-hydroxylase